MKKVINTFDELEKGLILDLSVKHGQSFNDKILINSEVLIPINLPTHFFEDDGKTIRIQSIFFRDCGFYDEVRLEHNTDYIFFENCKFYKNVMAYNASFKGKVRFRNCEFFEDVNFWNASFKKLADFWSSTFHKPISFYKTDFLSTTVFSSVKFIENVLFTYTLFEGKTIFGRTKFKKGLDISQSIIAGKLQLFDLDFDIDKFEAEYVGNDDKKFQECVHRAHKIPLINKVATFQILKNQFSNQGNHIDEISMRKQEKTAFAQLMKFRKLDEDWKVNTSGDRLILWLNRWSNHYKSDFRNGIVFTLIVALIFLFLSTITTGEFWNRLCFKCEFDRDVIGFTIKSFINFLNPIHKIDYLDSLKPFFGIPYVFDFLGRIAVGYGIYQTVQAFRKYK